MSFAKSLSAALCAPLLLSACARKTDNSALDSNVASIAVKLDAPRMLVGFTTQANAAVTDAVGNPIPGSSVGWYSSNPKVANVNPSSGVVTALAPGVANIVATIGGQSGGSRLVVGVTEKAAAATADSAVHDDSTHAQSAEAVQSIAAAASPVSAAPRDAPSPGASPQANKRIAHDFDDGSYGPFDNSTPGHNSLIDDPTGSGHGKVLQIRYACGGGEPPCIVPGNDRADLNQYAAWLPKNGPSHGSTFYFKGQIYYPSNTPRIYDREVLRKIIYFRTDRPNKCDFVINQWGDQAGIDVQVPNTTSLTKNNIFRLNIGRWNTLEIQITTNSRPGVSDGLVRVWHDGALAYENTHIAFTSAADPLATHWSWLTFGHQREGAPGDGAISEVRYWDNIAFTVDSAP